MSSENISGYRKAAVLLVLLGEEVGGEVLKHMYESEIEQIGKEISKLGSIGPQDASETLSEYHGLLMVQEYMARGGSEYAKKILTNALGSDQARKLIDRVTRAAENMMIGFDHLQKADPQQLAKLIQHEHPQTIALVVAHLDSTSGAALLGSLPPQIRAEVTMRMASLEQISPEIINKISTILGQKLQALGESYTMEAYGGVRAVAEMLNRMDSSSSRSVLEQIEAADPNLALSIRNLMLVFDDLLLIDEVGMREILQQVNKKTLAVALKGTSEEIRNQFFQCMTQRATEILREDMEALGPIKVKDVETAQQEIVGIVRKLEEEGVINLRGGGEKYVV